MNNVKTEPKYSLAMIEKMSTQEIERILWVESASKENGEAQVYEAMVKRLLAIMDDKGWA